MSDLFDARGKELNPESYVKATYNFRTKRDPLDAVIELCKSQSTSGADWGPLGRALAETDKIIESHGCKLIDLQSEGGLFTRTYRGTAKVAFPLVNFGPSLSKLQTALTGEIGYLKPFESIRLINVEFPNSYLEQFKGPNFGIEGIRKHLGVHGRPIIIAVIKPSVGISNVNDYARLAFEALVGGADMVKDDELLADEIYSPLEERVKAVAQAAKRAEELSGRKKTYLANITGDNLQCSYETAISNGADAVMVNAWTIGLSAVRELTKKSRVPVFSHFDNRWIYGKERMRGVSYKVMTTLDRLTGIDAVISPCPIGSLEESKEDILQEYKGCNQPLGNLKRTLHVVGGGLSAVNVPENHRIMDTNDLGYIIGHGIFSHPDGTEAGARSIMQALGYEKEGRELNRAREVFTKPRINPLRNIWSNIPIGYKLAAGTAALMLGLYAVGDKHRCKDQHWEFYPPAGEYAVVTVCPHKPLPFGEK